MFFHSVASYVWRHYCAVPFVVARIPCHEFCFPPSFPVHTTRRRRDIGSKSGSERGGEAGISRRGRATQKRSETGGRVASLFSSRWLSRCLWVCGCGCGCTRASCVYRFFLVLRAAQGACIRPITGCAVRTTLKSIPGSSSLLASPCRRYVCVVRRVLPPFWVYRGKAACGEYNSQRCR